MTTPVRRTADEVGRLGDAIYERDIRSQVEKTHHGKIVAIDVNSGDYLIDDIALSAAERLLAQNPDADIWCVKIGYPALYRIGGGSMRRAG